MKNKGNRIYKTQKLVFKIFKIEKLLANLLKNKGMKTPPILTMRMMSTQIYQSNKI